MQVVHKDKVEGDTSRRANSVGFILHARRIGRCLKREYDGKIGDRRSRI